MIFPSSVDGGSVKVSVGKGAKAETRMLIIMVEAQAVTNIEPNNATGHEKKRQVKF